MITRDPMIGRQEDRASIVERVAQADCVSLVGVSNIGKSTLCRSLAAPHSTSDAQHGGPLFVYIDLNLMLQMTEQGFYEIVLRNVRTALRAHGIGEDLRAFIDENYDTLINPRSDFVIPLAFEESLQALCDAETCLVALVLDEFDEVLVGLDPRVFVRLRALKDRYWDYLSYVTATGHPLPEIKRGREAGEFSELFAHQVHYLRPLAPPDARALLGAWAVQAGLELSAADIDFALRCAGGHPVLLDIVGRALADARDAVPAGAAVPYQRLREHLDGNDNVRLECAKLWNDLTLDEQEAVIALLSGPTHTPISPFLTQSGIVQAEGAQLRLFADLFAGFVQRQRMVRHDRPSGVRVDVESGDVWVDGQRVPDLTDLEYKLLLLLYGRLDKICDKYEIVRAVWGEEYMDEVDDSRIEKLVSRLRQKLEPDAVEPRYLTTVRGRGYRLIGNG